MAPGHDAMRAVDSLGGVDPPRRDAHDVALRQMDRLRSGSPGGRRFGKAPRPPPVARRVCEVVGVAQLVERRRRIRPRIRKPSEAPALDVGASRVEADGGSVGHERRIEAPQRNHRLVPERPCDEALRVMHDAPANRAGEIASGLIGHARDHVGDELGTSGRGCRPHGRWRGIHSREDLPVRQRSIARDDGCKKRARIAGAGPDTGGDGRREEGPVRGALPREQHRVVAAERGTRQRLPHPCGLPGQERIDPKRAFATVHPRVALAVAAQRGGAHERCCHARERRHRRHPANAGSRRPSACFMPALGMAWHRSASVERQVGARRCARHAVVAHHGGHRHGRCPLHREMN